MGDNSDNWWTKRNEVILKSEFPLHSAIRDGDMDQIASLLKTGRFNLYEEDGFYGWTPVHWAAHYGKLDCLMQLLQQGASCDGATLRFNQTPAHIAALSGKLYCLKWLLNCGASLNKQDHLGEAPLHKAARSGSMECANLLVCHGASVGLRNQSGHTPAQVASLGGFTQCALHLEKSQQFQEQSMAANIVSSSCITTNNNNNNVVSPPNAHTQQLHNGDSRVHMNGDAATPPSSNGHSEMDMDSCHGDTFHNVPSTNGTKRLRDDQTDKVFKRRRYSEDVPRQETTENNNIVSSYHSILAISASPPCINDSQTFPGARVVPPCLMEEDHPTLPCVPSSSHKDVPFKCIAVHSHLI